MYTFYKEQKQEKMIHAFPFLIMALKDWAASWKIQKQPTWPNVQLRWQNKHETQDEYKSCYAVQQSSSSSKNPIHVLHKECDFNNHVGFFHCKNTLKKALRGWLNNDMMLQKPQVGLIMFNGIYCKRAQKILLYLPVKSLRSVKNFNVCEKSL